MEFLKRLLASVLMLSSTTFIFAQSQDEDYKYERSSLCLMMVQHPDLAFDSEIQFVFKQIPMPERFNDHSLGVKVVKFAEQQDQQKNIESFIRQVDLGKRCVARWFNRDKNKGTFDVSLLRERGFYDASALDINIAKKSARGMAVIEDAGEKLIDNTFLVMNDIYYVDKSNKWMVIRDGLNFTTSIAGSLVGIPDVVNSSTTDDGKITSSMNWLYGGVIDNIKGFRVNVTSYLFRLKWDDETAGQFYTDFYTDSQDYDKKKVQAWQDSKGLFKMEFVGKISNKSSKTIMSGVKTNEELIKKVCTRALDKNIADLQHSFAEFRIKAPLVSTEPLKAYVGMKEEISEDSRFEVLERSIDDNGCIRYKRIGIIRPKKDQIWDNRFMAVEEGAVNATLGATTFEKVSGGDFYQGMLIREIK